MVLCTCVYKVVSEHLFLVILGIYLEKWIEQRWHGEEVREFPGMQIV